MFIRYINVTERADGVPHRTRHHGRPAACEGPRRRTVVGAGRPRVACMAEGEGHRRGQAEVERACGQDGNPPEESMKVAVYARVSCQDQCVDNQLIELRRYVAARRWT